MISDNPVVQAVLKIISSAAFLVIALVAYASYAERSAEQKAKDFCSTVKVGENADAIVDRAKSSGADERRTRWSKLSGEERWLPVTFTGFTPISRHICSVRATANVSSSEYLYLD